MSGTVFSGLGLLTQALDMLPQGGVEVLLLMNVFVRIATILVPGRNVLLEMGRESGFAIRKDRRLGRGRHCRHNRGDSHVNSMEGAT